MTNRPFKKITVRKTIHGWNFWIGMTMEIKKKPSFVEHNLDDGFAILRSRIDIPKREWYYRIRVSDKTLKDCVLKQARIERVSMKQEDDLLPWQEAYEVWCTYARML